MSSITPPNDRIEIKRADITTLHVDAIVNAANQYLISGGGVCGAIHKAAGPALEEECKDLFGCEEGQAEITAAYNLPSQYVIHTVGPRWLDGQRNEADLLASCYKNVMRIAQEKNIKTIAFPAISTGIYNYPIKEACEIAISKVFQALSNNNSIERVIFACVQTDIEDCLTDSLSKLSSTNS